MNYIIVPVRNNLYLTRKAVKTFREQDIGDVRIIIIDNASSDGTAQWLSTQKDILQVRYDPPKSVAESWNIGLDWVFGTRIGMGNADYALVVNNDVELRPDTYRWLVANGGGFVTAVGTNDPEKVKPLGWDALLPEPIAEVVASNPTYPTPDPNYNRPHPDFSCFLIRREVYEKVGMFDENFKIAYCEDGDYDMRMWQSGIRAYCIDLPFLHHGAGTVKNGTLKEQRIIHAQAEKNREYFAKKHGVRMGSQEYYEKLGKWGPESKEPVKQRTSEHLCHHHRAFLSKGCFTREWCCICGGIPCPEPELDIVRQTPT